MDDVRISDFPNAAALKGSDIVPIVQDALNKNATMEQILAYIAAVVGGSGGSTVTFPKPFQGKKWVVDGDSITQGGPVEANPLYHAVLKDRLGFTTVQNIAIGGSAYHKRANDDGYPPWVNRALTIPTDADVYTNMLGVNDLTFGVSEAVLIGTNNSEDINTIKGAMNVGIRRMMARIPMARKLFFTPVNFASMDDQGRPYSTTPVALRKIADTILEMCDLWSIPCFDLTRFTTFQGYNQENFNAFGMNNEFVSIGGILHPKAAGHLRIADVIEHPMRMLGPYTPPIVTTSTYTPPPPPVVPPTYLGFTTVGDNTKISATSIGSGIWAIERTSGANGDNVNGILQGSGQLPAAYVVECWPKIPPSLPDVNMAISIFIRSEPVIGPTTAADATVEFGLSLGGFGAGENYRNVYLDGVFQPATELQVPGHCFIVGDGTNIYVYAGATYAEAIAAAPVYGPYPDSGAAYLGVRVSSSTDATFIRAYAKPA